jgi:hypothetical protein
MEALIKIQSELKAPKSQYNSFGKYSYRNAEDILEAVKPLLSKYNATMYITDEVVEVGGRIYVKATVTLSDGKETITASAYAREPEDRKGMDASQITGATSSYARKYALNGLFAIDDTKDNDTNELREEREERVAYEEKQAKKSKFTDEQMEQMKKWAVGDVFTSDELADIKKRLGGSDWEKVFADTQLEYERRTAIF